MKEGGVLPTLGSEGRDGPRHAHRPAAMVTRRSASAGSADPQAGRRATMITAGREVAMPSAAS
jgi:hypothetical protein